MTKNKLIIILSVVAVIALTGFGFQLYKFTKEVPDLIRSNPQAVEQTFGDTVNSLPPFKNSGNSIIPRDTDADFAVDGTASASAKLTYESSTNLLTLENLTITGTCTGCSVGTGVASDGLDFDEFENTLNVDAATTINTGAFALTFDRASVSGNFEIAGGALFDGPADYSISSIATSSGNRLVFTNRGGTDARYWFNTSSGNNVFSLSSGGTEYTAFGYVSNATRLISYNGIPIKFDFGGAGDANTDVTFSQDGTIISDDNVVVTNVLQVGGTATVAYSRFGTAATGHSLGASNDLIIGDDLEVDGDAFFDGGMFGVSASLSGNLEVVGYASISNGFSIDPNGQDGFFVDNIPASFSGPFEVSNTASISKFNLTDSATGIAMIDCDTDTQALGWDITNKRFFCGDDDTGSTGNVADGLDMANSGGTYFAIASMQYDSSHFTFSNTASAGYLRLDWGDGGPASASQDEIITGSWEFRNGASVSKCTGCDAGVMTVGPTGSFAQYITDGDDDDIQINAALTACSTSSHCSTVQLLEGDYYISDVIQMPSSVSFHGSGIDVSTIIATASYNPVTACDSGGRCMFKAKTNPANDFNIRAMTIDCNANNITGLASDSSHRCVDLLHVNNVRFEYNKVINAINWSVFFRDATDIWADKNIIIGGNNSEYDQNDGIHLRGVQRFSISGNFIDTNGSGTSGDDAIAFGSADADTSSTSHGVVKGNVLSSGTRGIEILVDGPYDTNNILVADNTLYDIKRGCILFQDFEAGSSGMFINITIDNNTCYRIGTGGVEGDFIEVEQTVTPFVKAFKNLKITNNTLYGLGNGASTENGIAVAVSGDDLTISGNTMASVSASRGIRVGGSTRPVVGYTIIGNTIDCTNCVSGAVGMLLSGTSRGTATNNTIIGHKTGTTAGIVVDGHSDAAATYNNVSDNPIYNFDTMILEQNTTANPNFNTYDNNINEGNTVAHTLLGANSNYRFNNDGKWTMGNDFILQDAGTSRFIFASTSTGRFGFGDISPETFFEIASASGTTASISNVWSVDATNARVNTNGVVRATRPGTATQFIEMTSPDSTGNFLNCSAATGADKDCLFANLTTGGNPNAANGFRWKANNLFKMSLMNDGKLGLNDLTPDALFEIVGTASFPYLYMTSATDGDLFAIRPTGTSTSLPFESTSRASISGQVYMKGLTATGAGDTYVCLDPTTFELQTGATCAASTEKVKENIQELLPNDWFEQLQAVMFKYKGQFYGGKEDVGLIAEEVNKISPLLTLHVPEDSKPEDKVQFKKGDPYAINWPAITALIIQQVQEQQKQIDDIQVPESTGGFNWGLLGLLGLVAFIPRRKVA